MPLSPGILVPLFPRHQSWHPFSKEPADLSMAPCGAAARTQVLGSDKGGQDSSSAAFTMWSGIRWGKEPYHAERLRTWVQWSHGYSGNWLNIALAAQRASTASPTNSSECGCGGYTWAQVSRDHPILPCPLRQQALLLISHQGDEADAGECGPPKG